MWHGLFKFINVGKYEVLIEPNEDSNRLKLDGKYLLVVSLDDVKLVKPETGEVSMQWEYKHLKKYGKSMGKFNLECGRASKTGPGTFFFMTNEGRKIFNHIHSNIQLLGSKTAGAQSLQKSSPQARNLSKKSHEAPAAIGTSLSSEYAVIDVSKKKKKRSSLMVHSTQDGGIATTTGDKAGVFRKLGENAYDTPILDTIKAKQQTVKQNPQQVMDRPFGNEGFFAGYSTPFVPSTHEAGKVKPSGKNPFIDEPGYETPMVPDQPIQWQESKLVQPTEAKYAVVTGDYDIPPEQDDELVVFSSDPFSNSSNTYTSPFDTKRDYVNDITSVPSYSSSKDGTTTTTALSFESNDDDGAVINPLLGVEDFDQYLNIGGDDDMWANLVNQKFN